MSCSTIELWFCLDAFIITIAAPREIHIMFMSIFWGGRRYNHSEGCFPEVPGCVSMSSCCTASSSSRGNSELDFSQGIGPSPRFQQCSGQKQMSSKFFLLVCQAVKLWKVIFRRIFQRIASWSLSISGTGMAEAAVWLLSQNKEECCRNREHKPLSIWAIWNPVKPRAGDLEAFCFNKSKAKKLPASHL